MGKTFLKYLDGNQVYVCSQCRCHLASRDAVISSAFHGRFGKALLFDKCVNTSRGPSEERSLITGLHVVADLFCNNCKQNIGWAYEDAYEESQRYKIGRCILERARIKKDSRWIESASGNRAGDDDDEIVEDEQEDDDDDDDEEEGGGDDDNDDDDEEEGGEAEEEEEGGGDDPLSYARTAATSSL